jgi:vacuolar-type H+-ATPase subunit E/Vma4
VTETLLEKHCRIIEHWLNDAESRLTRADSGQASITPDDTLQNALDNIVADVDAGHITLTENDRSRLTAIMSRFAKLENQIHAKLSWFQDLALALRDKSEK